jgi:hypothetical protein
VVFANFGLEKYPDFSRKHTSFGQFWLVFLIFGSVFVSFSSRKLPKKQPRQLAGLRSFYSDCSAIGYRQFPDFTDPTPGTHLVALPSQIKTGPRATSVCINFTQRRRASY